MCFYLTAILPKTADIGIAKQILNQYNLDISLVNNQYLSNQLHGRQYYFRITKDYCDCDTLFGCLAQNEKSMDKEITKLKKKGWGQAKIDKWLENWENSTAEQYIAQFTVWQNCFFRIFDENIASSMGLLKHWYHDDLGDEKINIVRIESIKIDDIILASFLKMEEDVLYQFYT